jgi:uncharacterized membrane protein YqhA
MERVIETLMYRSRWLLAPIYLGLSVALIALGIKFFQEVIHLLLHIMELKARGDPPLASHHGAEGIFHGAGGTFAD